ncbi:MAG: tetratricopeptide repeat protein [Streptomyces sp.]|jgi:tetratricopeptide (TPR) repeat protein|nr:tetratricopeptide repeat protein [Streptomyces sp.]
MQELIRQRSRAGFVGRGAERAAFRANFDFPPLDERHRFHFHVHGNAGVGKTFLARELEQIARECGALTAYVDESTGSVPEAMAAISRRFAAQGHRFKDLDRLLAAHRERRREAEAAVVAALESEPEELEGLVGPVGPSTGSLVAARAGLVGLGMLPGIGAFAGALDADRLARQADRLRAGIGARLRNQEDVQLVLSPEQLLTPVLLEELSNAAAQAPWIVLFFDTYERTGPFLDGWLHEAMTTDRYGAMPATVVVVTAGQLPLDTARWGGFADFVHDLPLQPFTEAEARGLLAGRGVVDEPVVDEVLRLTGGLPVLVSTLAEARPADPDDVGDPSATAVERFLKWEQDPVRRGIALACALPRRLDADVFRVMAEGEAQVDEAELDALYRWLRTLPFADERGARVRYHDVVRAPMLRLLRRRSPRVWADHHRRLAEAFGRWREEAEAHLAAEERWSDERWGELRLAETYHALCATPRAALPGALGDLVEACAIGDEMLRRWVRLLIEAGEDTNTEAVRTLGHGLSDALANGGLAEMLRLLLTHARGDERWRAMAWALRGEALAGDGEDARALEDFDRALALDPDLVRAHRGKALALSRTGDREGALVLLDRILELEPDKAWNVILRGELHRLLRHYDEAIRDLSEGIRRNPASEFAWASRGATHERNGDFDAAIADLNQALDLAPDYAWALARRARAWRGLGESTRQLDDLYPAVTLHPEWEWGRGERGDALRVAGRDEEALADYDIALTLDPGYASAYASRGVSLANLGREEEALADLNRAVELRPGYTWALDALARLNAAPRMPGTPPMGSA